MEVNRRVTTQDVSWFLDLHNTGQLLLDPPYQRRSVWSPRDRRFFLDTIFRGFPSPAIFLYKTITEEGKTVYAVVDGKQRLETIIKFAGNKLAIDKDFGDERLAGKKWKTIKNENLLARSFWDYVLPVEFINVKTGSNYVNEVFDRLNRNSRKLVEQELRHAKYDGWFITFAEREAEELDWKDIGVVTTARAKRMKDVQFLSELLIVLLKGNIGGFDQNEIDGYYAKYEEPYEDEIEFNEEDIVKNFIKGRRYLVEMEREKSAISNYAKDFKNLYSLWALIILNLERLPDAATLAQNYVDFMKEVNLLKDEVYLQECVDGKKALKFDESLKYYQNSIGASTEPPQRRERNNALLTIIEE